jgi:S-adenosylmethionine hydrolase
VGEITLAARRTYSDVAPGELLALVGSEGYLEIALREGSAAARLGLSQGAPIEVWGA